VAEIIVETMAEVLSILGIVTKEIGERRMSTSSLFIILQKSTFVQRILQEARWMGGDASRGRVTRMDRLTQEEALMVAAENLTTTHRIAEG